MARTTGVDLDALLATHQKSATTGPKCRVCVVLETVPAEWRAKLQAALDDRERYSGRNICQIINALELRTSSGGLIVIGGNTVDRHRRGGCATNRGHG